MTITRNYPVMQQMRQQKQMSGAAVAGTTPAPATAPDDTVTIPVEPKSPPAAPPQSGDNVFTQDDIYKAMEKARREEKDKLYPRIEAAEHQLSEFKQFQEQQKQIEQQKLQAEEEERKQREAEELSAKELLLKRQEEWETRFNTVQQEWQTQLAAVEAERDAQAALLEQENRFQELNSYKDRRLQEEAEHIHPSLFSLVNGSSEEAIESAIAAVKQSSSAILAEAEQVLGAAQRPRPISSYGAPANGPVEEAGQTVTLTADDIRSMDMAEWAANRDKILAAARQMRR